MSDPAWMRRCQQALETKTGDVWKHRKTGKRLTVLDKRGYDHVAVEHESGRKTIKQCYYLADDYEPEQPSTEERT